MQLDSLPAFFVDAAAKADRVYSNLEASALEDTGAVLSIFGDHGVAITTAPSIPSVTYTRRKQRREAQSTPTRRRICATFVADHRCAITLIHKVRLGDGGLPALLRRPASSSRDDRWAARDSVRTRRLIESKWYRDRYGRMFALAGDQNEKDRFENNHGGVRFSTSVGADQNQRLPAAGGSG